MGYDTDFEGSFEVDKPLDNITYQLLLGLATTRRMKRAGLDNKYGVEGEFYVKEDNENPDEGKLVDYNNPPKTQPSLYCQWEIQEDRQTIKWDGDEKFYSYIEWLSYIINKILKPKGYVLNGDVNYQGQGFGDIGYIHIKNNVVRDIEGRMKQAKGQKRNR